MSPVVPWSFRRFSLDFPDISSEFPGNLRVFSTSTMFPHFPAFPHMFPSLKLLPIDAVWLSKCYDPWIHAVVISPPCQRQQCTQNAEDQQHTQKIKTSTASDNVYINLRGYESCDSLNQQCESLWRGLVLVLRAPRPLDSGFGKIHL